MNFIISIFWCVNYEVTITCASQMQSKLFKWENKSSHNFAYISNISTYKQFLKPQGPRKQHIQISLKSVNNCGRSSVLTKKD